jgi:hypothetical protein
MLIRCGHAGGSGHDMTFIELKILFRKTASPCRGGAERRNRQCSFFMLLAVVTVVLPVITAAQHHETKMGWDEGGNNGWVTESMRMNSDFGLPFINGKENV